MTLKTLVELYDGITVFDVCRAIDAGTEDVISFSAEDIEAVKDTVLEEKVLKYSVGVSNHITVILEAKVKAEAPDSGSSTPVTP